VKPTLILLPGLMCDRTAWQPLLPGLGVVADCRVADHGMADSLAQMARQVLAQAPERFALAGHSMGGRIALEVMRMAPERVTHLGLFDTGHLPLPAGEAGEVETAKRMALLDLARTQGVRAMAAEWVKGMVAPERLGDADLIESILDMFERKNADIFECQLRALIKRPDASDVLRRLHCPTLVLCGEHDFSAPPSQHFALAGEIPARPPVAVLPGCGHMAMQENPESVLKLMHDWLATPLS
jgi:pimeloyl-ACP methyl ester carboxylesterase